jgi:hypothetical protein
MAKPLASRLQLEPGERIAVLDAPPEASAFLEDVDLAKSPRADGILAFARDSAGVRSHAQAIADAAADPGGLAWVAYPKRSSGVETDLTRDHGWEPLTEAGLGPVRQISLDERWSALRFRRAEDVGSRSGSGT